MLVVNERRCGIAVRCALEFGAVPCRVMAFVWMFPDIGPPSVLKVGFLRYAGESVIGEAEQVAA